MKFEPGEWVILRNIQIKQVTRFVDPHFRYSMELNDGTHRMPDGMFNASGRPSQFDIVARFETGALF